jgi:DNA modification methylase
MTEVTVTILKGDCREVLRTLPADSVHCVVTSPPYWRQRDYGVEGQLGLELTPEAYIDDLASIFDEVRRVLRSDGTAWVNIGDKWASGGNGGGGSFMEDRGEAWAHAKKSKGWRSPPTGYKDKDLVGLPFMLAFAMRARGWFWRQCNIWAKPNGMPESVSDRTTISHEYVLHFSKRNDYWSDFDSVRLPAVPESVTRLQRAMRGNLGSGDFVISGGGYNPPGQGPHQGAEKRSDKQRGHSRRHNGFNDRWDSMPVAEQQANGANLRSVWYLAPAGYKEGHYAVMPDELAAVCIMAGCPKGGAVLDPFGGAGTTGLVADRLGRNAILIELNPEYAAMAERRIKNDAGLFAEVQS